MAGVAGLPDTSNINECDASVVENGPAETAVNPSECRTLNDSANTAADTRLTRRGSRAVRGSVYFIRAGKMIKIGFSTRPLNRLRSLQTSHPQELEILGTRSGTRHTESQLHQKFERHHVRGEWFTSCPEIIRYIEMFTVEGLARRRAREVEMPTALRKPPSAAVLELKAIGRELSSKRSKMPERARPFASNLIEEIDQIVDDASLERMRPHMAYQQRRLAEALR